METWQFTYELPANFQACNLRSLLEQTWLLPHRIVHYLRIRQDVLVNQQYYPMNYTVKAADKITMNFLASDFRTGQSNYLKDSSVPIEVLFENEHLLVVNKPAGIKTHPNQPLEMGTLMNFVAGYLAKKQLAPYMVHRIDQQTSGAIIIAKNPVVVPILDRLISTKQIARNYLAWVSGEFEQQDGKIELPIGRDPEDKRKRIIAGLNAQSALTTYQVVDQKAGNSLVKLELATGRTHQLRVHLAGIGHPIIGDPLYSSVQNDKMLLHAAELQLILPFEQTKLKINAPIPTYFNNL
nr:RluA family pseudouridine synthase [Paucilactobacillus hokkaidonensis]